MIIYDKEITTMEEALENMRKWFEDKPWDMWLENTAYGPVIYVESIHYPDKYSDILYSVDDVASFVQNGGLND